MNFYSFPEHVKASAEVKDLIQKMLKKEPEWRLSLDKVLSHDFFKEPIPDSLPTSATVWMPKLDLTRTISGQTTSCGSDKPSIRPQSSNREVVTQRRNIFLDRGNEKTGQDSRGCSQNDRGMLMSARDTSPLNTDKASSVSRAGRFGLKNDLKGKRVGSAIHRWMTRNRTEQYLLTARQHFETKPELSQNNFESQFSKYSKKSKEVKPNVGVLKQSVDQMSRNKSSAIAKTIEYNTTSTKPSKSGVKVEYASTLGPQESGKILISKWVDYSSKYGIGYKLSNGWYGVLFNDSTKMLLNENLFDFIYVRRESSQEEKDGNQCLTDHYSFGQFPTELKKKVMLLQHFKSYLDGVKFEAPSRAPFSKTEYNDVFLKKWRRAKKAILFRLSNKVIQVVFQDVSELILSSNSGNVTFITAKREVRSSALATDLEKKDPSLFKRLNYAKEILVHMLNPSKNSEKTEKENVEQRERAMTARSRDGNMLSKLNMLSKNTKSAFETHGLVTSRSKAKIKF